MTTSEFSSEFDILYNNIMSNLAPGLDAYEKSVFLTRAQENLIISVYGGISSNGMSFERTEAVRRATSSLIKDATISSFTTTGAIYPTSVKVALPNDLWFITFELATVISSDVCLNGKTLDVVPTTLDNFHKIKRNPFKGPNKRYILRLDLAGDSSTRSFVELIYYNKISDLSQYYVRYIKRPKPIILAQLSGVTINGETSITQCELEDSIHNMILTEAVNLAALSYKNNSN